MPFIPESAPAQTASWLRRHPITDADRDAMAGLRAQVSGVKGKLQGTAARQPFDAITERVAAPAGVSFRPGTVGGVPGVWCTPPAARAGEVLLHLHGGWFTWGTAHAFRNLVGQIATRIGVEAFIPEYRLAPEHPFPAGLDDAKACYLGLTECGERSVVVTGDSAGGALALLLAKSATLVPAAVAVLSPVTDLALTGESWRTRADADPYFTRNQVEGLVGGYLDGHDPRDPGASPLYGDLIDLPPIRIHVGEDEVLLDDAYGYGQRAFFAGSDATVDVWEGMPHGFVSGVGRLSAADQALDAVGAFLTEKLASARSA